MGACESREEAPDKYPGEFSVEDLSDLVLDQIKSYPKGCGPFSGSRFPPAPPGTFQLALQEPLPTDADHEPSCAKRGFKFPQTGEFEHAMGSECKTCFGPDPTGGGASYGCECAEFGGVEGRRCAVKRIKYLADPVDCCTKDSATVGNLTCDPKYRLKDSAACKEVMQAWCGASDERMSKFQCKPYRPADWEAQQDAKEEAEEAEERADRAERQEVMRAKRTRTAIGITVGAVVVLALVILIVVLVRRRK